VVFVVCLVAVEDSKGLRAEGGPNLKILRQAFICRTFLHRLSFFPDGDQVPSPQVSIVIKPNLSHQTPLYASQDA
jgi:hypothetical protein